MSSSSMATPRYSRHALPECAKTVVVTPCDPGVVAAAAAAFLARGEPLLFDTETTGLSPQTDRLVTLQLTQASAPTTLILDCRPTPLSEVAPAARAALQQLFAELLVVGHNLKFDAEFLLAQGLRLARVHDTMLGEQLLGQREVSLAATLQRRYVRSVSKLERTWFFQPAPLHLRPAEWAAPLPEEELRYAALDVETLSDLYRDQVRDLSRDGLREVAAIEMRALPALAAMELRGVRVEQDGWRAFIAEQAERARFHENRALCTLGPVILGERLGTYDAALLEWEQAREDLRAFEESARVTFEHLTTTGRDPGGWGAYKKTTVAAYRAIHPTPAKPKLDLEPPNIGSQKQLISGLKALGVPVPTKKNERGETVETTDSDNLERLVASRPEDRWLGDVLAARKAQKFVDAFGEKLLAYADAQGRIHPDYHQIGADTGRMSCSKPNWQQVPARGDGQRLRACVIADPGQRLITADFSNIELRIIADLAHDKRMLAMFASGEDLHSYTARLMFDLGPQTDPRTTPWRNGLTYRAAAKIVNYLIPYGGSAFAIAMQNNMLVKEAETLVDRWFTLFSVTRAWMKDSQQEVHRTLESRTRAGRARRFLAPRPPTPQSGQGAAYHEALREYRKAWASIERQARNSPVQGLSADITKLAVALFHEAGGALVAVVHDELVAEAPLAQAEAVAALLAQAMDRAARTYLKTVTLPYPQPTISERWEHD